MCGRDWIRGQRLPSAKALGYIGQGPPGLAPSLRSGFRRPAQTPFGFAQGRLSGPVRSWGTKNIGTPPPKVGLTESI
jgi:hypothetical protein